eukprot:GSChrysophyteH1.ASY1.ANO1.768.1 assembled CDS
MGAAASFEGGLNKDAFEEAVGAFYTSALFRKLAVNDKISLKTAMDYANNCTDVFLTHDWGSDEQGRDNHARVSKINSALKARGLKTWFDEDRMEGKVKQQMLDGIDSSAVVIAFVTDRYMGKVAGKGDAGDKDNCMYEFEHATRTKGAGRMIAVVNEKRCQNPSEWYGALTELAGTLYYTYISDDQLDRVVDEIYERVLSIMNGRNVTSMLQSAAANVTSIASPSKEKGFGMMAPSPSTPALSDDTGTVNVMAKWLTGLDIVPSRALQYAQTLVAQGVGSQKRLGKMLSKVKDGSPQALLVSKFHIDEYDADDVVDTLVGSGVLKESSASAAPSVHAISGPELGGTDKDCVYEYIGEVKDGKRHGKGAYWRNDKSGKCVDVFVGNFENDMREGDCQFFHLAKGSTYNGEWHKDTKHGQGTFTWASGERYTGQYADGLMEGKGKYVFASGAVYEGEWHKGTKHGQGTFTWASGERYTGQYADGLMEGKGKYVFASGAVYEGEWHKNKMHGQGTYTWAGDLKGQVYTGQYADDLMEGKGKKVYASGDVYEGEYHKGKMHGQGTCTWASGERYTGQYADDLMEGKGKYVYASGDVYEGEWHKGNKHGQGTFTWASGARYTGQYADDLMEGKGKMVYKDGAFYEGEYHKGKMHGQGQMVIKGKYVFASGAVYEGEWHKDKKHGQGTNTWASGARYTGQYADDLREGKGKYVFASGAVYEGEYHKGKMHGQGTFTWTSGERYTGQFADDLMEGKGKYVYASGNVYEGEYHKGKMHGQGQMVKARSGHLHVG